MSPAATAQNKRKAAELVANKSKEEPSAKARKADGMRRKLNKYTMFSLIRIHIHIV